MGDFWFVYAKNVVFWLVLDRINKKEVELSNRFIFIQL
jgi:hypothetical protein